MDSLFGRLCGTVIGNMLNSYSCTDAGRLWRADKLREISITEEGTGNRCLVIRNGAIRPPKNFATW